MQTLWLLFLMVGVLIFIVPIKMKIRLSYDLLKNRGVLGFGILFFKMRILSFKFKNMGLEIKSRSKKEKKEVELKIDKEELIYNERLLAQFRDKLKIRKLTFKATLGMGDAFKTAMVSGLLNILIVNLFIFIKNFKQTTSVKVGTKPEYNKELFRFKSQAEVSISLFDLLFCFLFALINTKRSIHYNEKKVQRFQFSGATFRHEHSKN